MPVRPSNMNYSHSSNRSSFSNATGYFLSDDTSFSDDSSDSDFSFEIEEETVQKPKQKKLKDVSAVKQTNKDLSVQSYSSSQPKHSYSNVSREAQRSLEGLTLMERKAAFAYTAGSARKRDDESIMSDDDFSISVASEIDGLMCAVKSTASKSTGEMKHLGGGIRSIEQSRVTDKSGDLRDEASTISSKTASLEMRSNERNTSMKELYLKRLKKKFKTNPELVESCRITTLTTHTQTSAVMSLVLLGQAVIGGAAVEEGTLEHQSKKRMLAQWIISLYLTVDFHPRVTINLNIFRFAVSSILLLFIIRSCQIILLLL